MFIKEMFYTRRQIYNELGGNLQAYLPVNKGRVVCACLTKDLNPTMPYTILVGSGPRVKSTAAMLCLQRDSIPVFLKESVHKWRYVGNYRVEKDSTAEDEIAQYAKLSGRTNISRVIHLAEVG